MRRSPWRGAISTWRWTAATRATWAMGKPLWRPGARRRTPGSPPISSSCVRSWCNTAINSPRRSRCWTRPFNRTRVTGARAPGAPPSTWCCARYDAVREDCGRLREEGEKLLAAGCTAYLDATLGKARQSYDMLRAALASEPEARPTLKQLDAYGACRNCPAPRRQRGGRGALPRRARAGRLGPVRARRATPSCSATSSAGRRSSRCCENGSGPMSWCCRSPARSARSAGRRPRRASPRCARVSPMRRCAADTSNAQDEAWFRLEFEADPKGALALALTNWSMQKEPRDAELVLQAALATRDRAAARPVLEWMARHRHRGSAVEGARRRARAGRRVDAPRVGARAPAARARAGAGAQAERQLSHAAGRAATGSPGQWDIALRDLEYAIGLDADGDGAITWGELRAGHAAIERYALARLKVTHAGAECRKRATSISSSTTTPTAPMQCSSSRSSAQPPAMPASSSSTACSSTSIRRTADCCDGRPPDARPRRCSGRSNAKFVLAGEAGVAARPVPEPTARKAYGTSGSGSTTCCS